MDPCHLIKSLFRLFVSDKSKLYQPIFIVERLDPRLLLSAVCDIDQDLLSPLITNQNTVSDIVVQLDDTDSKEVEVLTLETPITPILQIELDSQDSQQQPAESESELAYVEDSDSGEKSQAQYDLEHSIALFVTADYTEINAGEIIWTDVNDELEGTDNCELQSIVEQLTETLRVPHGPPNNNEMSTSSQNDSSSSNQRVHVGAGTQFDLTIRVQMQDSSVIEIFDNSRGIVLAGFALESIDNVLVVGGDESNDTLTIDLSTPFSVPGGIQYVGGDGGYDKLVMLGCPELSVDYVDSGTDAGIITVSDEAGQTTTVAFSGLEPFVYLNHFGEINNSGFFNYGNSPEILDVATYTQASDATLRDRDRRVQPGSWYSFG